MVKKGFSNLPEEKQKQILNAALEEFAEKDFHHASFNEIIKKAGISKGSMYHYFNSKEDLYFYLIDKSAEKKKNYLLSDLKKLERPINELSFFEKLHFQMKSSINFALDNPELKKVTKLMENLQNSKDQELRERVMSYLGIELDEYLNTILEEAVKKGEINRNFDKNFLERMLKFLFMNLAQIFPETYDLSSDNRKEIERILEQFIDFLKKGIQSDDRRD